MDNKTMNIREENIKPDLLRRGFEFFKYRDLPARCRAADNHIHDAVEFVYLAEGEVKVIVDGKEDVLHRGDMVMFRSRGAHSMYTLSCPLNKYYTLKIRPKLIYNTSPKDISAAVALRFSMFNRDLKYIWRANELEESPILKGYKELMSLWEKKDTFNDIAMLSSVLTVIYGVLGSGSEAFLSSSGEEKQIYDSIVYVNSEFAEDISAEQVAEQVNMSYSHFARSFKQVTGNTFTEYLNITRVNEAEHLLANTDLAVSEIAIRCGYNSISYFISIYKRYKGKTPLAERKSREKTGK